MAKVGRRTFMKAGAALAPGLVAADAAAASGPPAKPQRQTGFGVYPANDESNPLGAKIVTHTVVSPDMEASVRFYRDVMGYSIGAEGRTAEGQTSAPGAGRGSRRYVIFHVPNAKRGATIRVVEAPAGAAPNRPRPEAKTWDPGLLIMECGTSDPVESYHVLKSAGTPTISTPRYYPFRGAGRDLDPMSYAPFGPAGEQMFITANIANNRPAWEEPGLHTVPSSVAIVSLDQRPVDDFYLKAFGMRRTSQLVAQSRNCNDLIGAPADANFLWGNLGTAVSMEVWEFRVPDGTVYPTSLDRTGLAMFTLRVNDLETCRPMCRAAGITPVGEGAWPVLGTERPRGFTLRGAVGELVEVIG
jgi:hypothetical protein